MHRRTDVQHLPYPIQRSFERGRIGQIPNSNLRSAGLTKLRFDFWPPDEGTNRLSALRKRGNDAPPSFPGRTSDQNRLRVIHRHLHRAFLHGIRQTPIAVAAQ
jgi:hypothetical protein